MMDIFQNFVEILAPVLDAILLLEAPQQPQPPMPYDLARRPARLRTPTGHGGAR